MRAAGSLNPGQGNSLIVNLERVIAQLENGKGKTALTNLNAFMNQVAGLVDSGVLSAEEGEALLVIAEAIAGQIGAL